MNICAPCEKALRKRGKHRDHFCEGGGSDDGYVGWRCQCECQEKLLAAILSHNGGDCRP